MRIPGIDWPVSARPNSQPRPKRRRRGKQAFNWCEIVLKATKRRVMVPLNGRDAYKTQCSALNAARYHGVRVASSCRRKGFLILEPA